MIREQGTVVKTGIGAVTVAMVAAKHTECRSCGVCKAAADGKQMLMNIRTEESHQVGDKVTVEVPGPGQALSAVLLLLVPLLLFLVGLGLGRWLMPGDDAVAFVLGVCAMGIGFGGASLYDRRLRRSPKYQPRIVGE